VLTGTGRPPVIVAPYDAELFGHWWFEGPDFLDSVVRKIAGPECDFELSTPTDVLNSGLDFQVAAPAESSWGANGYSGTWLNDKNAWIWPHVHHAAEAMQTIARERRSSTGIEHRALNQLGREILLASASDWPFMMTMDAMSDYATTRVQSHILRFNSLLRELEDGKIDTAHLEFLEEEDNIFAYLDYHDFA
jgi:1,4-alpha-glucan branching enzyme